MVATHQNPPQKFTPEEYLAWEEKQSIKHEYLGGQVYAMTGGTVNHGRIAANFIILLGKHLGGSSCRVQTSDVKVEISKFREYVYPDVSVTCDERDYTAIKFIRHPCLIIEVLSPSTEGYDRGGKFNLYRRSDSLQDYVLVNADKMELDIYRKNEQGRWEIINYEPSGDTGSLVELQSLNLTFPIEQIYEGIIFHKTDWEENPTVN
jgi:Uma2 family endonuclease